MLQLSKLSLFELYNQYDFYQLIFLRTLYNAVLKGINSKAVW